MLSQHTATYRLLYWQSVSSGDFVLNAIVWFQKIIHTHPKDGQWKFRGGGGSQKGKYKARPEITGGGGWQGSNQETTHGGGMDIFWNHIFFKQIKSP